MQNIEVIMVFKVVSSLDWTHVNQLLFLKNERIKTSSALMLLGIILQIDLNQDMIHQLMVGRKMPPEIRHHMYSTP